MDLFTLPKFLIQPDPLPDRILRTALASRPRMKSTKELPKLRERTPSGISDWLEEVLPYMDTPEVYASGGDEMNSVHRDLSKATARICVVGGMTYRASVGNLAVPLVYSELVEKGDPNWVVDRCYLWETRRNFQVCREAGVPPFGHQTRLPLDQFDALLFSCSYLQTVLHVPLLLKHSGIPWRREDRIGAGDQKYPLIIVGGHHVYVNPEPIYHVPDFFFLGEFSAGALDIVRRLVGCSEPVRSERIEAMFNEKLRGLYPAWLFKEEYSQYSPYPIIEKGPVKEMLPATVEKAYVSNLDTGLHVNMHPIVPFLNPTMGTAELQTSLGCDAAVCSFCSEGQTNKPYRYFSINKIVDSLKEMMKWSGMRSVTLSAFDGAGHPQKNVMLTRLLEEVSDDVSLLSLRVDQMADDPEFATLSTLAGNRTLSLGVEQHSDHSRRGVMKWCTEEQILAVATLALQARCTKLKFFMIASHPFETEEDQMQWIETLKKIQKIRDDLGSKCTLLTSWTPLVIMPNTFLQWEKPTIDVRSLGYLIDHIKSETNTDFRIGSGGRKDEAYMAQLFQLGDRRLSYIVDWLVEHDFIHYGATSKGLAAVLGDLLSKVPRTNGELYAEPLGYHTWFREKPYSEILPWEHLDKGVSKEWLIAGAEMTRNAQQFTKCSDKCTMCGACSNFDRAKIESGMKLKDPPMKLTDIKIIQQTGTEQIVRLQLEIDREHRFIGTEYWIAAIRRAFYLAEIPIDKNKVHIVGERYKFFDFSYGIEYADVGLMGRVRAKEVIEAIGCYLPRGLTIRDARTYSANLPMLGRTVGAIDFKVNTSKYFTVHEVKAAVEQLLGTKEFIAVVREKVYKKGVVATKTNVRPLVEDAWVEQNGDLHLLLKGKVNPFELIPALFHASRRRVMPMNVQRMEAYLAEVDSKQMDAFRPVCPKTGVRLPANLFDEVSTTGLHPKVQSSTLVLDTSPRPPVFVEPSPEDEEDMAEDMEGTVVADLTDELLEEEL